MHPAGAEAEAEEQEQPQQKTPFLEGQVEAGLQRQSEGGGGLFPLHGVDSRAEMRGNATKILPVLKLENGAGG